MFTHLMRRKPQTQLLTAAWSTCIRSLPGGRYHGPVVSSRPEAGSRAISGRLDCQLPNVEAMS